VLHKTKGILLKTTPYSESSVVAQIYTEKFGLQAYLVNGVKRKQAKIKSNILQPLYLLDMVVYHKANTGLQRIAEARQLPPFQSIPYDVVKSAMVLFLDEMLYKSLKQQSADTELFEFLYHAICWLDSTQSVPVNFHLYFLLRLTKYLGFLPALPRTSQPYFDLKEGVFTSYIPNHAFVLQAPHTDQLASLLQRNLSSLQELKINNADRRILLNKMVDFYSLHVENFGEVKSPAILEEILG